MPERQGATTLPNLMRLVKSKSECSTSFQMFTLEGSVLKPALNFSIQGRQTHSFCLQATNGVLEKRHRKMKD